MKKDLIQYTKNLFLLRYPVFASELAKANIEYRTDLKYHTAATDGKNIYIDPDYLESLSDDDKVFLIAHELMHIKFNHALRIVDKNGDKRDPDIWNHSCDAIINANLECDGLKIKDGYVNEPDAIYYAAEELYDKLMEEKEKNPNFKLNNPSDGKDGGSPIGDDHSLWEEAYEAKTNEDSKKASPKEDKSLPKNPVNEKEEFTKIRDKKKKIEALEKLKKLRENMLKMGQNDSNAISVGDVGLAQKSFDWRLLLRREIEKNEFSWTQRRSVAENNYAYRLMENDTNDETETEVMIDVSGSVSIDLVKGFLRMLKPLLEESKLKVGCFNEKFWGMTEIKTNADIDNFKIPSGARGYSARTEDWDLAVRSFTKKREINKIVFTDGEPCPGNMPKSDLKNENVIWLVYGNENFKPCCGKVIQISEEELKQLHNLELDNNSYRRR